MRQTILVVDDDERLRDRLAKALQSRGFEVSVAAGLRDAMALVRKTDFDRAVVDLRMPDGDGLELVRDILTVDPEVRIVVLTGYGSIATAVEAIKLGAVEYLAKPADVDMVLAAFEHADAPPLSPRTVDYEAPSLDRLEWEHIQRVLHDCGGNVSEAARRLGLHRRTLQRKLQRYAPQR